MLSDIPLSHIIIVSTLMFFIGVYGFVSRKNLFAILMSVELVLNAVALNFAAFNYYLFPGHMHGLFFSLFIIGVAAAEAAVAIAIIIALYKHMRNVNVEEANTMKY